MRSFPRESRGGQLCLHVQGAHFGLGTGSKSERSRDAESSSDGAAEMGQGGNESPGFRAWLSQALSYQMPTTKRVSPTDLKAPCSQREPLKPHTKGQVLGAHTENAPEKTEMATLIQKL